MDVTVVIVAWYLTVMSPNLDYPILFGPYESRDYCGKVETFVKKFSYVTNVPYVDGGCSIMSVPQLAELLILPEE